MNCLKQIIAFVFTLFFTTAMAQPDRWQQRIVCEMEIDFDVKTHRFNGKQHLIYVNNSPDYLDRVFYHLYFNAFQPGSMMDVRSRNIADPDHRVSSRISKLKQEERGYQKVISLTHNGVPVEYEVVGTILEVQLKEAIPPKSSAIFDMEFEAQVPVQIRRSGRDNKEGISYSMSQWYPKMCEYDYQGWHANPYIGREFYGVWGDFDVKINIDRRYAIGGTGYLQNPGEIGYGYEEKGTKVKRTRSDKLSWHFFAPNVHDFVWAADPDYTHTSLKTEDGVTLHFLYQKNKRTEENWALLPEIMKEALSFVSKRFGAYPYKQYSFIQGGDGGMEYPMATLITGERGLGSLVGVSVHELMHNWYQMLMGTNESLYAWMDEGFTTYASNITMNHLRAKGLLPGSPEVENPHAGSYTGYRNIVYSGKEEPLSTHADHFVTNTAYGIASYSKGSVFLNQLGYIIGEESLKKGLLRYYDTWKFKHPNINDFIRIMEKESGLELDWYKEYWVNTIHYIDYSIGDVNPVDGKATSIQLNKSGVMPMPIDVKVSLQDGSSRYYTIPLRIMRGEKEKEGNTVFEVAEDWPWTNPEYTLTVPFSKSQISKVEIDPTGRMADMNLDDNALILQIDK